VEEWNPYEEKRLASLVTRGWNPHEIRKSEDLKTEA
jgi:hypothetical protein